LSNLAWSYASLGVLDQPLMTAISAAAIKKIDDFSCQDIMNLLWAFAKLDVRPDHLIDSIAAAARKKCSEFNA
jgi:hypothetical protein